MRNPLIWIIALFFTSTCATADNYKIFGYIYLPNREPAGYTNISIEGTTIGTTAREDGYYELKFHTEDSAKIDFSILGCKKYIYTVTPKTRKTIQKMVYLEEDALMMKDVEVTDFAKQGTTMNKIDISKLDVMPSVNGGIEGLISTYAGVSNRNELSSQYSVRGGNYDENSIYVNDIEVYRPLLIRTGEQEGLSFINPDMVESVDFSAGGYGATYGDKMASVLDIRYKKPKRFEASISGSLLGAQGHIGHSTKNGKFTQLHGIRYKSSDYLFSTLDTKGTYDQKFIDYQTYITYKFTKKWEFDLLGNFSRNIYNNIPESRSTTYGTLTDIKTFRVYFDGQEKDIFQTEFGALTLKYCPTQNLNLRLITSAYESYEKVNYDIIGEYWIGESVGSSYGGIDESAALGIGSYQEYTRNRLRVRVIKAEHRGDYHIKHNTISWGASIQKEAITDNITEFETRDSSGYITSSYNLRGKSSIDSWRTQFFIQDESRFKTKIGTIGLLAGIRGNFWTFNKEFIISPRATVSFFPKKLENLDFRFSTGVYYQSPFYKEVRIINTDAATGNSNIELNNNIKSQRSLHFVLGSDYYFKVKGRPFKFTTEIYYKPCDRVETYNVENLKIVYSGNNDAKAYTTGVDFKLFGEFVPGTDSWIGLSLMQSKEKKNEPGAKWVSRPNEQRYNFTLFFQDYIPGLPKYKIHLRFIWEDGLPFWAPNVEEHNTSNTNKGKAYRRVDLGASRTFAEGDYKWLDKTRIFKAIRDINLGLEIFNLFDLSNVASYYWVTDVNKRQHAVPNYLTGRQFNVRLKINF